MKAKDGRRLSHEALEQLRINAVLRVEEGESPELVIKSIGFERVCIYRWIAAYRMGGLDALKAKKLNGRPPILTGEQLMKLFTVITKETPEQYKFPFALWTLAIIRDVIRQLFGVRLSEVSVWRTMQKLGLSPQRPLRRAYQQKTEAVQQFLVEDFPKIKTRAKRIGASLYWGDEASIRSDYHSGTTWAKKGETPVVRTTGARFKVNMMSAIDARGNMRFMISERGLTVDSFIEFLRRLIAGRDHPVFLIVDGHPVHRGKKVKAFVQDHKDQIELYYLPGYSPELNPDELVWNHVKSKTVGKMTIKGPEQMKIVVRSVLKRLAKMPQIIRQFFLAPDLRYIVT